MEDHQIVELYLARDESALARTAEKYGGALRALARNLLEDPQAAEECENDVYLAAWNAIPPHEPRDYLFPFLARIARHTALDRCRERSRRKRSAPLLQLTRELEQCLPAPDNAAGHLEDLALGEAVNRFLGSLSEENRNIFLRRYWYMDPVAAIAERYALTQSKVKVSLYRSRNRLRESLRQEGYDL
nr:sigma-70 family RNA polymerase sigma factor [uncultured Oscillibacter sp.]